MSRVSGTTLPALPVPRPFEATKVGYGFVVKLYHTCGIFYHTDFYP